MSALIDTTTKIKGDIAQLDKLFEHRSRLAICVLLTSYDKISFRRFKELMQESDGNLGAQLRKLEDEKYISISKEFENRRPISWYSITKKGHKALSNHLTAVESLMQITPTGNE